MRIKVPFFIYKKIAVNLMNEVTTLTDFNQGQFSFMYLGYPITHARKRKSYYMKKVTGRLPFGRKNYYLLGKRLC